MKTTNTFGIHFFIKRSKLKDGKVPIYARITVNKRVCEISVKQKIILSLWNHGKGLAKPSLPENLKLNSFLEQVRSQLVEYYQELVISKQVITPIAIKNKFLGIEQTDMTLIALADYHNTKMKETLEWGTLKNYFTTKKYIEVFLRDMYRTSDKYLSELNYKFISDFEYYLRTTNPLELINPMGNNTIMKHIERLRKMVNMAVKYEWIPKDPFAAYKAKFLKVERGFLSEAELEALEQKELFSDKLLNVRDLFVFSCYTGLSYIDLVNLKPENISIGIDREYWIFTNRKKTDTIVRIPLLPKAIEIIEKYKFHPVSLSNETVFPNISNQKMNDYLKEIANLCEIKKNLTFHIARHTFATTVTLSNGVPIESVSKMLGHTSIRTTQIYAKVVERKLSQDMKELKSKLYPQEKNKKRVTM